MDISSERSVQSSTPEQPSTSTLSGPVARSAGESESRSGQFEWMVGGKAFAILGALVVTIGVGLFLKMGVERGWFSLPPGLRCVSVAILGAALVAGGEYVRRRIAVGGGSATYAAAGLSSTGLVCVYGSVLAASGMYQLISTPMAFVLLACVSVLGAVLALMGRSLVLGLLALCGAYMNPVIIGDEITSVFVMPTYLLAVLGLGLVLAGVMPRPMRPVRWAVWVGTFVLGIFWIGSDGWKTPWVGLGFLAAAWAVIHAELVVGALRLNADEYAADPSGGVGGAAGVNGVLVGSKKAAARSSGMLASFLFTLWGAGLGASVAQSGGQGDFAMWMVTGAWTVACTVLALILGGNLRVLRDAPESDCERLSVAMWGQAAALLIATVALGLSSTVQSVVWLAMGVGAIVAGRWASVRGVQVYGLVLLSIATARLLLIDSWIGRGGGMMVLGLNVDRWSLLMVLGGCAWGIAAVCVGTRKAEDESIARRLTADLCAAMAAGLPVLGVMSLSAELGSMAIAVALASAGLAWLGRWRHSLPLMLGSLLGLLAAVLAFMCCYMIPGSYGAILREGWGGVRAPVLLHPGLLVGAMLVAIALAAREGVRASKSWWMDAGLVAGAMGWCIGVFVMAVTSLEVARSAALVTSDATAQGAAVSLFWAIAGLAMVVIGFVVRGVGSASVRVCGLVLLGVAALKVVVVDIEGVGEVWRVFSMIGVGVLMLLVAVVYARVAARFKGGSGGRAVAK